MGTLGKHWKLSEATKAKMRKPKSAEHRAAISAGKKGKPSRLPGFLHSEETKRKMSEIKRGKRHTEESRAKMRASQITNPMRGWLGKFHYGKIPMRSSWEVFLAQQFDALGVKWLYEPRTFDLGTCRYTPDFYLPDDDCYWEVKGYFTEFAREKTRLFREQHPEIPLVVANKEILLRLGMTKTKLSSSKETRDGGRQLDLLNLMECP